MLYERRAVAICRQFGWSIGSTPEAATNTQIARILFPELTHGGPHAYGWMTSREAPGTVTISKFAGRADTKAAQRNIGRIDDAAKIVVGHTRFATHGSPLNLDNNHPVRHGNVIGVHNGIVRNYQSVLKQTGRWMQRSGSVSEVDSEAIFAAIGRWGPSGGLRKIDADMVAVWIDLRKPHLVSIARSELRPCHIGWTDKGNVFWASERKALERLEKIGIHFTKFSSVSEYRMLTIKAGKIVYRYTYDYEAKALHDRWMLEQRRRVNTETRGSRMVLPNLNPMYFDSTKLNKLDKRFYRDLPRQPNPAYGPEWEGTALAAPQRPAEVSQRNGPALTAYLNSIAQGDPSQAERVAAAAEIALVEKRIPLEEGDDADERYFFNGAWLPVEEFIQAVSDAEAWDDLKADSKEMKKDG